MNRHNSLLVCILPGLETAVLGRYVDNAVLFARQIGAVAHLMTAAESRADVHFAVERLCAGNHCGLKTVFHPMGDRDWTFGRLSEAARLYGSEIAVIPSGSVTNDDGIGPSIRKELLEKSRLPVLILSPEADLSKTPIESVLIPISGEVAASAALRFGLGLASAIHVPADLVHAGKGELQSESALERIGDQSHHEYRRLLEGILAEASPFSNEGERALVRSLYHGQGSPSFEILKATERAPECALVLEWRGTLIHGRAETLKQLLRKVSVPLFLVKAESGRKSVLKIGPDRRAA